MLNEILKNKSNLFNETDSDNLIRLTEAAYSLNKQNLNYDKLISFLNSDDISLKCYAMLRIESITNQKDAELLTSCLNHIDSRIRELASELIKNHLINPESRKLFDNDYFFQTIISSIKDKNPKVCRNIINILQYINNKKIALKEIFKIIKEEIAGNNSNVFTIYWSLFAIENLLDNDSILMIDEIFEIILKTSKFKEYQIRERSAFIVKSLILNFKDSEKSSNTYGILDELTKNLSNDGNFYVRNAILS